MYAAKLSRKPERVAECLEALIVNIGATLDETLYEKTHSVVYASATIAVGDDFKNFLGAMGLGETEESRANTCMLGSSYDFDKNMQVLVLTDIPEPISLATWKRSKISLRRRILRKTEACSRCSRIVAKWKNASARSTPR